MNKEFFIQLYIDEHDEWSVLRSDYTKQDALDYVKTKHSNNILYRIVDSCTLSIDSHWYNGLQVSISLKTKTLNCGKYQLAIPN
jgi:hypothetical protein